MSIIVAAQLCSTRFASLWKRWCNCGEALSASAQRKPTETKAAIMARLLLFERANVLIAQRPCYGRASCARNFCKIGATHAPLGTTGLYSRVAASRQFLRESATCDGVCRRADIQERFRPGDCDLLSASAPEGRRGCAPECDEILRQPPASDRCG